MNRIRTIPVTSRTARHASRMTLGGPKSKRHPGPEHRHR